MRRLILFAAALMLSASASAGMRARYSSPQNPGKGLTLELADNGAVRVGEPAGADYGLMIGDAFFLVQVKDGKPRVARIADVAAAFDRVMPPIFKQLFSAAAPSGDASKLVIARIGPQSVNGRAGIAYSVKGLDQDKPDEAQTFVVSEDPALAPIGRALARFIEGSFVLMTPLLGPASPDLVAQSRALARLGTPLAGGDGLKLETLETGVTIDPARVTLPGKPETVDAIAAELKTSMKPAP